MNLKFKFFSFITILSLTSLACGLNLTLPDNAIDIGPVISESIQVPNPTNNSNHDVQINFGGGNMDIRYGASPENLIEGTAAYNVENLKPEISISSNKTVISQDTVKYEITGLPNFADVENVWALQFNDSLIALEIRGGAFKGNFDFGGMSLYELKLFSGASTIDLDFSSPNLTPMSFFKYTTGASSANLMNLANANFSLMEFDAGVGTYVFDFSGILQRDATVDINVVGATIKIIVPENIPAQVILNGKLTNVNLSGNWSGSESAYSQPGEGNTLLLNIQLNGGSISLQNN